MHEYITSVCVLTGDFNPYHLVKIISARFFHCRVTNFLFLVDTYLGGDTLN